MFLCITNLLSQCGDVKTSPGPRYSFLIFCHWNLNDLPTHDFIKTWLLQAYITHHYITHNYDIISLSETFLNTSIQSDDHRIKIDGYNLIRSDIQVTRNMVEHVNYKKEHIPLLKPT